MTPGDGSTPKRSGKSRVKCHTSVSGTRRTSPSPNAPSRAFICRPWRIINFSKRFPGFLSVRRTSGLYISLLGACLLLEGTTRAGAESFIDPALRFRTLRTTHFAIHFHQGEERLAARLGPIAEAVWLRMRDTFHRMPPKTTEVILADQSEVANGWATPIPYNTIFITPSTPAGSEYIGRTDDWLRLVFT